MDRRNSTIEFYKCFFVVFLYQEVNRTTSERGRETAIEMATVDSVSYHLITI